MSPDRVSENWNQWIRKIINGAIKRTIENDWRRHKTRRVFKLQLLNLRLPDIIGTDVAETGRASDDSVDIYVTSLFLRKT